MKTKRKIILSSITVLIIAAAIFTFIYLKNVTDYQNEVKAIVFTNIDISSIKDGTYYGQSDVQFISAKVKVEVESGKIKNIELLEHINDRGKPAEKIVEKIIEKQTIDVDAVSGATNSSKVIKKAVENALIGE